MFTVLVTGGLGFVGSHVCISLLESGYRLIIEADGNLITINSNRSYQTDYLGQLSVIPANSESVSHK